MRRTIIGTNPDGSNVYEYADDTKLPASGLHCARDELGVPVAEAGRLQEAAFKESGAAPTDAGGSAEPPATPRSGRSKIKE